MKTGASLSGGRLRSGLRAAGGDGVVRSVNSCSVGGSSGVVAGSDGRVDGTGVAVDGAETKAMGRLVAR